MLDAAIDEILATPQQVELVRPKVLYEFADPALEGRSALQKQLRMGPAGFRPTPECCAGNQAELRDRFVAAPLIFAITAKTAAALLGTLQWKCSSYRNRQSRQASGIAASHPARPAVRLAAERCRDRPAIFTERIKILGWLKSHLQAHLKLRDDQTDIDQQRVVDDFGNAKRALRAS